VRLNGLRKFSLKSAVIKIFKIEKLFKKFKRLPITMHSLFLFSAKITLHLNHSNDYECFSVSPRFTDSRKELRLFGHLCKINDKIKTKIVFLNRHKMDK